MGVPGTEIAQYGIGFFAVAGIIFLGACFIKSRSGNGSLTEVIKNNTKAVESLIPLIQALQITMAEVKTMQRELLAHARKE